MSKDRILVYGATGFNGKLIVEKLAAAGCRPIVAGRDLERLTDLARQRRLAYRCFELETPRDHSAGHEETEPERQRRAAIVAAGLAALQDVKVVLNAAGPFASTAKPLALLCLEARAHYVDISGELSTFRALDNLNLQAEKREVMLVPGAAFSIVAGEALARHAIDALQKSTDGENVDAKNADAKRADAKNADAKNAEGFAVHRLRLAYTRLDHVSHGSALTMIESIREGVLVQRDGNLVTVRMGQLEQAFAFNKDDRRVCTAMNLAEVFVLSKRLGIRNLETYVEATAFERWMCDAGAELAVPLRLMPAKMMAERLIGLLPAGPSQQERSESNQVVVAEVEDRYRRQVRARLATTNSYDFTIAIAAEITKRIFDDHAIKPGFRTAIELYRLALLDSIGSPRPTIEARPSSMRAAGEAAKSA